MITDQYNTKRKHFKLYMLIIRVFSPRNITKLVGI